MVSSKESLDPDGVSSKSNAKDHLMSVKEEKDEQGNVTSRSYEFNSNITKHLVNEDGTINTSMVAQIKQGTKFDEKAVNEALALEIMKARGLSMSENFENRQVVVKDGMISIQQTNTDGSTVSFSLSSDGNIGKQLVSDYVSTDKDGNVTSIRDNGIQKRTIQKDARRKEATVSYAFKDTYYQRHKWANPLNSSGDFAIGLDKDKAMLGFSEDDLEAHKKQVLKGKPSKSKLEDFQGIERSIQDWE